MPAPPRPPGRPTSRSVKAVLLLLALSLGACTRSGLDADRATGGSTSTVSSTTTSPSTTAPTTSTVAVAGAPGVGDPYYPELGNGGLDVGSYDLALSWDPGAGALSGAATIRLRTTEDLDTFNLDLRGMDVTSVRVDGVDVPHRRDGSELVIDPGPVLGSGEPVTVEVVYEGVPEPVRFGTDFFRVGWHALGRGAFVASEPGGAATWFPANDHPTDKATFRLAVTVPDDLEVLANGQLASRESTDGRTTWVYESDDAMATYLASVVIGELVLVDDVASTGTPLRSGYPPRLQAAASADFARIGDMLVAFGEVFGPYPFDVYGHAVVDTPLGFALENQGLSLFGSDLVTEAGSVETIVAHELAHQWFGNAVSPATWRDIWLNEGFATYAEWVWAERSGGPSIATSAAREHAAADYGVPPGDPGPEELFQPTVYIRGGLALYALSQEIGTDAFARLLPAWVERFGGGVASTEDLRALAEELSGQDLRGFFDAWVYGASLPPLP